jgi:hypothetical protein
MRRLSLTVVAVTAGLIALTACGTTISGVAEPSVTTATSLAALVQDSTAAANTASYHLDMSVAGVDVGGDGQFQLAGTNTKIQMNMSTPIGQIQAVIVGGTMYMKLPQGLLHTAKPWVKFDANGTDPVSKELSALTSQEQQNLDPTKMLTMIAPFATITGTHQTTVGGASATEYSISVDTTKMLHSNIVTPEMRSLLNNSNVQLPAKLNYQVWLNSADLPVKFVVVEPVSVPGSGAQTVTVSMTYTNWGQPVTIQAPPAGQVGSLTGN